MDQLSSASVLNGAGRRAFEGGARADNERLFRAAMRHSRYVRVLRHAVPVGIVLTLAGIASVAYFNPFRALAKLPFDPAKLVLSGTKITMQAPRLAGYTRDGRPYELTARAAAQDITKPGLLELRDIHAKVQMKDTAVLEMNAAAGLYDTKTDKMRLDRNIVITSSTGYKGRLQDAAIDIRAGKITSKRPVTVEMLNGTLNANNLEVGNSGDTLVFGGGVVMDMVMKPAKPDDQKASTE